MGRGGSRVCWQQSQGDEGARGVSGEGPGVLHGWEGERAGVGGERHPGAV